MLRVFAIIPLLLLAVVLYDAFAILSYRVREYAACPADTLLVMGAAQYNGAPSPAFRRRLDRAYELYRAGCAERIIVTGGKREGDNYSEGDSGVSYLEERGIPDAALQSESSSRTSFENLSFSRDIIGSDRVLIVTDDLHAYRSLWLAQHLNLDASVAPVDTGRLSLRYGLRELAAVTTYNLGRIR